MTGKPLRLYFVVGEISGDALGADLVDQFAELGFAGRARELALRLMAHGQGISVMAHVHSDPAFLARETAHLRNWLDRLADGDDDCA